MASLDVDLAAPVGTCGTCGYRGDGMPYFRRTEHAALLVAAALVTYGIGGLVYWIVRRDAWVCPGCGASRVRPSPTRGQVQALESEPLVVPRTSSEGGARFAVSGSLPAGGFFRRVIGAFLAVVGVTLLIVAATEASGVALAFAVGLGLAGVLLFRWGGAAQERRREALLVALQTQALHLARTRSGRLTATEAAAELHLTLPAAENVLFSLDDGFRVRSEITRDGLLVFDFPELRLGLPGDAAHGLGRIPDVR